MEKISMLRRQEPLLASIKSSKKAWLTTSHLHPTSDRTYGEWDSLGLAQGVGQMGWGACVLGKSIFLTLTIYINKSG